MEVSCGCVACKVSALFQMRFLTVTGNKMHLPPTEKTIKCQVLIF